MDEENLTAIALEHLGECLEGEMLHLAGKPLAFVLIVTDGTEFACTSNMPNHLIAPLLKKAAIEAQRRAGDRLRHDD